MEPTLSAKVRIHTNGSSLKPGGRKPNAFLEIFGIKSDLLMPANLNYCLCLLLVLYLNDTNIMQTAKPMRAKVFFFSTNQ